MAYQASHEPPLAGVAEKAHAFMAVDNGTQPIRLLSLYRHVYRR